MSLLVGDIGGTHTRLALTNPRHYPDVVDTFVNAEATDLVTLLGGYLRAQEASGTDLHVRLAVAAPITGDVIELTNFRQRLSTSELCRDLGVRSVRFINDYTAIARGLPYLTAHDRVQLGGNPGVDDAAMGVLGPGTGFGVSGLVPLGDRWASIVGEGGHCTLAATTAEEFDVISRIAETFGHVSAERVVSGPGLLLLYETLCRMRGDSARADSPAAVTELARNGADAQARDALALFFGFLGGVAGDLALTLGARGGVYLAGGILPRMIGAATSSTLRKRFEAKGRFRGYLREIPLYIVTHRHPALLGLIHLEPDGPYRGA